MRKWMIAGIVLVSLAVVVVLAVLNINSLINRNKDYLLDQAQQALGRKISIGEVGVALWSGIGVRVENFSMSDDGAFSNGDFVRAKDLQVNLKLLPLLRKEIQVKRVILHEPVIGIIRDKSGEFNFSTIARGEKDKKKKAEARGRERTPTGESKAPPALLVSLVDISDGDVRYRDHKEGIDLRVKQIDLRVKDLDFDKPFTVELAAALFSEKQNVKLQSRVGPLGREGDFNKAPLDGEISLDPIDIGKLKAALPKIKSALPKDLDLSGVFRIKEMKLKGNLDKLAFRGGLEGTDGAIQFGNSFRKDSGIPLVVSADAVYGKNAVTLRQAKIKLHTLEVAGKGDVKLGDGPVLNLTLDSNRSSLAGWEKIVPAMKAYELSGDLEVHTTLRGKVGKGATPQIQGTLTLANASVKPPQFPKTIKDLDTKITFTGQQADIKETQLSLGNSKIRLAAAIERFSPLTLSYNISTPEIWPADFQAGLPDERKADVIKNLSSEGKLAARDGNMTFQGKIASTQGTLYKIAYKDLGADLSLASQVARIQSFRVNALSGSVQADGEYAFGGAAPRFSSKSRIRGVDIKQLYAALAPKAEQDIRGRLNADMSATGSGKSWEEIKPALRGQGEAEVVDGALLNFNLAEGAMTGITGIPGLVNLISPRIRQKYPDTFEAKDTEFKEMKALFDLADARMNVKSLRIAAADYLVQGKGWVDFDRKIDFHSSLIFSQRLSADLGDSAREVKYLFNDQNQFEMPFVIAGRLPKVKPRPDSGYLAKAMQRGFLRKGTDELQRRFFGTKESAPQEETAPTERKKRDKGSTEDLIRKGLEGLFGR